MIGVVRHHAAIRRNDAAQRRKNLSRNALAILNRSMLDSAEQGTFFRLMLQDEFAHLVDGVNAVQVAIALRGSPGEQPVAAKNQAFGCRDCL